MKKILLLILIFLSAPFFTEASTAVFRLDSGRVKVNALEGALVLPKGFDVSQIQIGGSSILMWIEEPNLEGEIITFSGIIPGGLSGEQNIFSLVGEFTESELSQVDFANLRALNADGSGTEVSVKPSLSISEGVSVDSESPVPFSPVIGRSRDSFDGKYFLTFLTQDKGVGVSHYEYALKFIGQPDEDEWVRVESPYALSKADLFGKIYIKAVDAYQNERVESVVGPYYYIYIILWVIILVLLSCVLIYSNRLRVSSSSR